MKQFEFKEKIVFLCWTLGLLLIICVFWIATQGVQAKYLLRTINNVFIYNEDTRRIHEYLPQKTKDTSLMGYWYSLMNSQDSLFVFTIFQDGILVPLGAVVSQNSVKEVVPLSFHAEQVFDKIPQSVLQMYIRRIEQEGIR